MANKKKNNNNKEDYKLVVSNQNDFPYNYDEQNETNKLWQRNNENTKSDYDDRSYGNIYEDDPRQSSEYYKTSVLKRERAKNTILHILLALVLCGLGGYGLHLSNSASKIKNTVEEFEKRYSDYNKVNDSYKEYVKYLFEDLERTKTTIYPDLIQSLPETKNYSKYCLPCSVMYPELKDVFNVRAAKRRIENIKNIPLSETNLYIELASKVKDSIDNYKDPKYVSAFDILQKPSITDLDQSLNIFRSWLWASMYYISQEKPQEALLLAYAPILACQDIEANSADGAAINTDLLELQIDTCNQLLYLANYSKIDTELGKKISINFFKILKSEPSFTRKVENNMRCENNFYKYLKKHNNAFAIYVHNSKTYKDWYEKLYNGAIKNIKEVEDTGDYSKFSSWQKEIINEIKTQKQENLTSEFDSNQYLNEMEITMCRKAFSNSLLDYFSYFCLYQEKKAIMTGTAVAIAYKVFQEEKNREPFSVYELKEWLGIDEIPNDPLYRKPYSFSTDYYSSSYPRYLFTAFSLNNSYYKGVFIKETLIKFLVNKSKF